MSLEKRRTLPYSITGLNPYPWISWWYVLAAPAAPRQVEELSLKEREFLRRGKLISIALLIELILLLIQLGPATHDGVQSYRLILVNIGSLIVATLLNHFGKLLLGGLLLMFTTETGMFLSIVSPPGGHLGAANIPFIFLLIQPLMISVLLFPSWGVLVMGAINVFLTGGMLLLMPRTPEVQGYMQSPVAFQIVGVPIATLIVCALISFIVITSLQESLVRADKAEEVAKLQQVLAERVSQELQAKRELETEVQEIVSGLTRFANGNQQARIRLERGHSLWSVASSINNMMGRFSRLREQEKPMEQTFMALQAYLAAIRMSKVTGTQVSLPHTGTEIDTLVEELLANPLSVQRPQQNSWHTSQQEN